MTTTTADPHSITQATDAFCDAWAAVYIDVAEKLEAEERRAQAGVTAPNDGVAIKMADEISSAWVKQTYG